MKFVAVLTSVLHISFTFCVQILPPPPPLMRLTHTFMTAHKIMRNVLVACFRFSASGKGSNCQLTNWNCVEYSQTGLTRIQTTGERGSIPRKGKNFSLPHLKSVTKYYKSFFHGIPTDVTMCSEVLFLCMSTLHVSGGTHAHHQEYNLNCINSHWYNS